MALAAMLTLAACTPATEAPPQEGIVISEAVIRTPMGGQSMTAGYFQVTNHTDIDDALIGVESPISNRIEMHTTEKIDGNMRMRRQDSFDLKAGETVMFKPKGNHLMLFDVQMADGQTDAALTLKFKHAPDVTIIAEIGDTASYGSHN